MLLNLGTFFSVRKKEMHLSGEMFAPSPLFSLLGASKGLRFPDSFPPPSSFLWTSWVLVVPSPITHLFFFFLLSPLSSVPISLLSFFFFLLLLLLPLLVGRGGPVLFLNLTSLLFATRVCNDFRLAALDLHAKELHLQTSASLYTNPVSREREKKQKRTHVSNTKRTSRFPFASVIPSSLSPFFLTPYRGSAAGPSQTCPLQFQAKRTIL